MHKTLLAVIALMTLLPESALVAQTPPGVPTPSVTLAASMEQPVCLEGKPAVLALALHNGGTERRLIGGSAFEESSFRISITDGAGRAVPRTAVGERVLTPPMSVSANSTVVLSPGQTLKYRFNLARLFDLSRAGNYTVSVSRTVAPWLFFIPPPKAGEPASPKETNLTAGPLVLHMAEDPVAKSGPTALAPPTHQTFFI